MFVEYLFEVNPITMLLLGLSTIFVIYLQTKPVTKNKNDMTELEGIEYKYYPVNKEAKDGQESQSTGTGFSFLSYNIMAYNFTKASWYPYCDIDFLQARYRSPRILKELKQASPDIICLQECDHDLYHEFYKPNLDKLGYESLISVANPNRIVTIVIAYKRSVFSLVKKDYLDLNEDLDKLDDSFHKHKEAMIALLKHKITGKSVTAVNTHLFWNPEYEYVKYGQISKIFKYIESKYNSSSIVISGDFNSMPWSNVLRYVYKIKPLVNSNAKGDYYNNKKYMDKFYTESLHNMNIRSAYENYKPAAQGEKVGKKEDQTLMSEQIEEVKFNELADNHPDFTNYTEEFNGCLDYILYSADKLELNALMEVPNNIEIKNLKLPNYRYPSDHLKIAAQFRFSK